METPPIVSQAPPALDDLIDTDAIMNASTDYLKTFLEGIFEELGEKAIFDTYIADGV